MPRASEIRGRERERERGREREGGGWMGGQQDEDALEAKRDSRLVPAGDGRELLARTRLAEVRHDLVDDNVTIII